MFFGRSIIATALMLALLANRLLAADSLDAVRNSVRTDEPEPPREQRPADPPKKPPAGNCWDPESPYNDDYDNDQFLAEVAAGGTLLILSAPYWGPNTFVERHNVGTLAFAPSPYEISDGWMHDSKHADAPADSYQWGSKIRAEYLDYFDGLTGFRGHVLTEHVSRWGFDSETNYWRQSLFAGAHDELWTGDANVVFRFAQSERVQMRSGAGLAWLADSKDVELGFNFTYGGDIYPLDPLVISADMDAGWIGSAWMIHLRSTVGVVYKQAEVYTGYDYLEIGNAQLDGLIAGVRFYY